MTDLADALLRAESLTRRFGGLVALDGVDFAVQPGTVKAILGPNGAGKTTLFNVISGLQRPSSGRVICAGTDIGGWAPERIVRDMRLARTFQTGRIWSHLTVLETVQLGGFVQTRIGLLRGLLHPGATEPQTRERALEVLDFVGLADRAPAIASSLAYGDQRRLELARALATGPRILLLDEPAAGLDQGEADALAGQIRRLRDAGLTVLLVEHRMQMVLDVADELLVLHLGRVLADGKPDDVRSDARVIEVYLGAAA